MDNKKFALKMRKIILEQSKRANVGHIGSALSIVDIIAVLYNCVLTKKDNFILSKGHGALALYGALYLKKHISKKNLDSYCTEGTLLGVHPDHNIPGVEFSTGSLGHGLSIGAGVALAAKLQKNRNRVFVLLSDAECNEGSVWEAALFAAHHKLSNLVAIVDLNGQQAFGYTEDVLSLAPFSEKWRSFNWTVDEVEGHDQKGLLKALSKKTASPHLIIAQTTFGKGVSFMEGLIKWHYFPMSNKEYDQALKEIELIK